MADPRTTALLADILNDALGWVPDLYFTWEIYKDVADDILERMELCGLKVVKDA